MQSSPPRLTVSVASGDLDPSAALLFLDLGDDDADCSSLHSEKSVSAYVLLLYFVLFRRTLRSSREWAILHINDALYTLTILVLVLRQT
jgi:hypothetical protein